MILTVLAENSPNPKRPELKSDHGLSVHVDLESYAILYDFGSQGTMAANAGALGIDLSAVRSAYLSHGHYDHSGDMDAFLQKNSGAPVYHGPGAFTPRWSLSKGAPREVGVPPEIVNRGGRLKELGCLTDMNEYVILPAASGHRARPAGNSLLLSGPEGERLQDDFSDELTLVLRGRAGLAVVTGCSHRGILNIVDQVNAYCPECPILALIGGFHLMNGEESEDSIQSIGSRLAKSLPDAGIYSGHCTESRATGILEGIFGHRYETLYVGKVLEF